MAIKERPNVTALPDFSSFGKITDELKEYLLQQHIQNVELQRRVEALENP